MRNKPLLLLLLVAILLWNCATNYRPKGILGGYYSKSLGNDILDVRFEGNQHTSADQVRHYLLYRCAELTIENGFKYFVILIDESHFINDTTPPEIDQPWTTTSSMSGGTKAIVNADFSAGTTASKYVGIFKIGMLRDIEPAYADRIILASNVIDRLKPTIINH